MQEESLGINKSNTLDMQSLLHLPLFSPHWGAAGVSSSVSEGHGRQLQDTSKCHWAGVTYPSCEALASSLTSLGCSFSALWSCGSYISHKIFCEVWTDLVEERLLPRPGWPTTTVHTRFPYVVKPLENNLGNGIQTSCLTLRWGDLYLVIACANILIQPFIATWENRCVLLETVREN